MPNAILAVFQPLTRGNLTHMYNQIVVRFEIFGQGIDHWMKNIVSALLKLRWNYAET